MYEQLTGPNGVETGHAAVDKIGEYKLCATPQNYEIWLNYIRGWAPDLTREIDKKLSNGLPITDIELEKLHNRFFGATQLSSQVMETGTKIAKEIADAVEALKSAGNTTEEYGVTLDKAAKTLSKSDLSTDALNRIVSVLSESTLEMSDINHNLNRQLLRSTREIEMLRTSLQAARAEALTDGLTGVANRKQFDEVLQRRINESLESGSDLCLIICDIDFFKNFNDTWGHQTGDQVIRFVANSLAQKAVNESLVARYGGEEFAIIMPRTILDTAFEFAESVRKTIESKKLIRRSTGEPLGQVTVSFGIANYRSGEGASNLIERADHCLYHSKQTGRNRITLESDPSLS
ncbi:GGDEF domain-containing protein [Hirschia baltica]|uniref:diguanylate cyclase n=1 Tax=Hirschia baltica (strain ATCC 49814 / DSM 5838 / IFAM 1418) TaxID=582402 RepID=C6XJH5_HIRBI|nr:GGDEF domain-containing protein [Hirschia baltica]ACT59270.1 diguanylate cyclase [Hirschia baltica ATCC 49814]